MHVIANRIFQIIKWIVWWY